MSGGRSIVRTQEQGSSPFSLSLWMDEEAAATAADEFVPFGVLERHFAGEQPVDDVAAHASRQWAYLHRPVVPFVDGNTGASA
jgi:hypothetical protein